MPESLHELLSGRLDRLPTQTAMSCSKPQRSPGRQSSWLPRRMETVSVY